MARHWLRKGHAVCAVDNRQTPPAAAAFADELPAVRQQTGVSFHEWPSSAYDDYDWVGISPGVNPGTVACAHGKQTTDAAVFADLWREAAPDSSLLAVTGTNGKSTTVALTEHLLCAGGLSAEAVGNIGVPLLDAWHKWCENGFPNTVIAELSSFQLALTPAFAADAAVVLNISPDHLDRHGDINEYVRVKLSLYQHAVRGVINMDDERVVEALQHIPANRPRLVFSAVQAADWRLTDTAVFGKAVEYAVAEMSPACRAQSSAVLASLALLHDASLSEAVTRSGLASFPGLPHRQQWVANINGVDYVNDSKATNVGATLFALAAVGGQAVLIAGGEAKGQDFSPLARARQWVRHAVLIGRAAAVLQDTLTAAGVPCERADSLEAAVQQAAAVAMGGQTVLLSPACASLDMFDNYAARGDAFARAVGRLPVSKAS